MFDMDAKDIIMAVAVIVGPILAVQIQKYLDLYRDKKQRRLNLFKTLMSTRAERLSREHVQALNMIDIEFYGRKIFGTRFQRPNEKAVTNAWKNYNSHLNSRESYQSLESWIMKGDELFTGLLFVMSEAIGYVFDEVQLKRDCYRPIAHGDIEHTQLAILKGLEGVLKGEKSIQMAVTNFPTAPMTDSQKIIVSGMEKLFKGEESLPIKIVQEGDRCGK